MSVYQYDRRIKNGVEVQFFSYSPISASRILASSISSFMTTSITSKGSQIPSPRSSRSVYSQTINDWYRCGINLAMLDHCSSSSLCHHLWGCFPKNISLIWRDWNSVNNPLGIRSQSETWFKPILQHHSGNYLVHDMHRFWGKILTSGIYQLHHREICTLQDFISNGLPSLWITNSSSFQVSFIILWKVEGTTPSILMKGLPNRRL